MIFIGIGFALGAVNPSGLPRAPLDLSLLGPELVELSPAGFLGLGVLLMILTPVARVLLSILAYVHGRDRIYAAITVLVFVTLLAGMIIGLA